MLSRRTMLIVTGGAGAAGLVGVGSAKAVTRVTSTGEASLTAQEFRLIAAMAEHPALIERPIAVFGQQAAIVRPLDNIEAILPDHTS